MRCNYKNKLNYLPIVVLLFLGYLPFLIYRFGFHNDFQIWGVDKKICCSWFSETWHLINVGRFIQAFLQNIYLSIFTTLESLAFGRGIAILVASMSAYLIAKISRKNGMDQFSSIAFGIGVLLLPPAQVNVGWITNFIPGLFNTVLVLIAAIIFQSNLLTREISIKKILFTTLSFILLLVALFNYPPTTGFFLLPIFVGILYNWQNSKDRILDSVYTLSFYAFACLTYFLIHRFFIMNYYNIVFANDSFYRFDITSSILGNISKYLIEIFPVMLNLFNTAPTLLIALIVLILIIVPLSFPQLSFIQRSFQQLSFPRKRESRGHNWILAFVGMTLFLAMNAPGLLAIGTPPTFYRAWHPGMAAILLLLFRSFDTKMFVQIKRYAISIVILIALLFAFNSSYFVASTLSKQFNYSLEQVSKQFSKERSRYIIMEYRPESTIFGLNRWGELGFIHILTSGHVDYILKRFYGLNKHPWVENIVINNKKNQILIESDLFDSSLKRDDYNLMVKSPSFIPGVNVELAGTVSDAAHPENSAPFSITRAFDNIYYTFWERHYPFPIYADIKFYAPKIIRCYSIQAGDDKAGARMPVDWRFMGSNYGVNWDVLDARFNETNWIDNSVRIYKISNGKTYLNYAFEFNAANNDSILRIYELSLSEDENCINTIP